MPTVINLDIGPQFLFGHTKPSLPVHDNVIIYDNIIVMFGYLSKSLGFFSGGSSPSSGSPPTISFSRLSTLSVITLMGRKFVAHLHPAGAFAPDQECTCWMCIRFSRFVRAFVLSLNR